MIDYLNLIIFESDKKQFLIRQMDLINAALRKNWFK